VEAALTEKTEAALDAVFAKKAELLAEGVSIVGDKVEAADTVKYDTVAKVTGKYYCSPGYCTLPAARKRALLQQSSQCQPCGADYYCPGGFQTLSNPNRVACPEPVAGSNIVDFTTDGVTTATSRNQCLVATAPGYYATDNAFGPALECGYGYYCPGGVQASLPADRIPCPTSTNTTTTTASSPADCVP
jgi:hypothetical protein